MSAPTVIDASPTYQPTAGHDAQALYDAGIRRAILKASEGATWPAATDTIVVGEVDGQPVTAPAAAWFNDTRNALRAVGIEVDTYHLTHARDDIAAEVNNLGRIAGHDVGGRIWVDAETTEGNAEAMGTHIHSLVTALQLAYRVPVGRYDNRSVDSAVASVDQGDAVWLAWPGYAGESLPAGVVLVQTGTETIGGHTYDVNVEIEAPVVAPPAPAPAPAVHYPTVDLRHADTHLVVGPTVALLQRLLVAHGALHGAVDGKAGPQTKAALGAFQAMHHLQVDDICGPHTWAALAGL